MSKGAVVAAHNQATRVKYGRFPAVVREWDPKIHQVRTGAHGRVLQNRGSWVGKLVETPALPLPGREDLKIEDLPEWEKLSKTEKFFLAENRKDYRQRIRPTLPRKTRKLCYSGELHQKVNARAIARAEEIARFKAEEENSWDLE